MCLVVKKLEHRQQKQYCNKLNTDLKKKWSTLKKKKSLKNSQGKIKIFSDNQKPRVYHQQTLIRCNSEGCTFMKQKSEPGWMTARLKDKESGGHLVKPMQTLTVQNNSVQWG